MENITIMAAEQKSYNCSESSEFTAADNYITETTIETADAVLRDIFYEDESRREVV